MPREVDSVFRAKGGSLEKQTVEPVESPRPKLTSLHRWLTAFVFVGSGLVYLSLIMQSALIFLIGEVVCVVTAPFVLWIERGKIQHWWDARGKCPACGYDLRGIRGDCPKCGYKRILE